MKRFIAILILLALLLSAAGCSSKKGTASPTAEPTADVSDGSENLGHFVVYPEDGVLSLPMMGLIFILNGPLLENQDRISADVDVSRSGASCYISILNENEEDDFPYDYTFAEVVGSPTELETEDGTVFLGKNSVFYYYAISYGDLMDDYPEYFESMRSSMTAEDSEFYDAVLEEAGRLLSYAEVLSLKLPGLLSGDALGAAFMMSQLQDLDGNSVSLGKLISDNKLTLINVWGTFCGPCLEEMPALGELAREFSSQSFGVIGLTCDVLDGNGTMQADVVTDARSILNDTGVDYPVLVMSLELIDVTSLMYVPTSYFVDGSGRILEGPLTGSMDEDEWRSLIEKHLKAVG